MATLLIRNAACVATLDAARRELADASVFVRGHRIEQIGPAAALPRSADEVIDARGHLVTPGLVNTHHHMFQSLTRAVPGVQDAELFSWLRGLYPVWAGLTPEMVRVSSQLAMAELLLSGCTTSSDHLYVYPNGVRLDDSIEAAHSIGMRFVATRGSMSLGQSAGGLPPDGLVEREDAILADTRRVIERWHDPARHAMLRVGVAPCSPFSVTPGLMREAAALARSYGVSMHTHLAESANDVAFSREQFGKTPAEYAESLGWIGDDVWHAHCVKLDDEGISLFAATRTGVAHCPCTNMRLAVFQHIVPALREAGVAVGLGVDGSASNDAANLLAETRQAMLLARVGYGPAAMSARQALDLATLGGARALRLDGCLGNFLPGSADIVAFRLDTLGLAGAAVQAAVAALLFGQPGPAAWSIINGRVRIADGHFTDLELPPLLARHNALARTLLQG